VAAWIRSILEAHPEITFFLILGIGHLLGKTPIGKFKLSSVTGTLIAGIIVGQLGLTLSPQVQQCFLLLFLFAIGFRTGPQFFLSLRKDGLRHAALAAIIATFGALMTYFLARALDYDSGTGGGLLAGALTDSAAIGTAMDAIRRLPLGAARSEMADNVAMAFAVTYLVGLVGAAWFLSQLAPRIMRINLADECRKIENQLSADPMLRISARRNFELRAYAIDAHSPWAGRNGVELEAAAGGVRVFVERLRRSGKLLENDGNALLKVGDVIAVSGPRETLVKVLEAPDSGLQEMDDAELLDVPVDMVDVVITNPSVDGRTLADLGHAQSIRGVFLKRLTRAGLPLGLLWQLQVRRGDVVTIVGTASNTARAAEYLGIPDRATDTTDVLVVSAAIVAGALVGLPALSLAGIEIGLSLPVGVLLGGLLCGWLRSVRPRWFGRIPSAALSVFEGIGLTGFVAVVGLNAGPEFVKGLQSSGPTLVLAAAAIICTTLLVGVVIGRWVFRMHPGVLLGVCAGACTATPALAAVQEAARSAVPVTGYGIAYAVGNVFIAVGGTVIVPLLH
jgi:putative transport protein